MARLKKTGMLRIMVGWRLNEGPVTRFVYEHEVTTESHSHEYSGVHGTGFDSHKLGLESRRPAMRALR